MTNIESWPQAVALIAVCLVVPLNLFIVLWFIIRVMTWDERE